MNINDTVHVWKAESVFYCCNACKGIDVRAGEKWLQPLRLDKIGDKSCNLFLSLLHKVSAQNAENLVFWESIFRSFFFKRMPLPLHPTWLTPFFRSLGGHHQLWIHLFNSYVLLLCTISIHVAIAKFFILTIERDCALPSVVNVKYLYKHCF